LKREHQGEQNRFKKNDAYQKFTLKFYSGYKFCFILRNCYLRSNYNIHERLHFTVTILSKQSAANVSKKSRHAFANVNSNCEQRNNWNVYVYNIVYFMIICQRHTVELGVRFSFCSALQVTTCRCVHGTKAAFHLTLATLASIICPRLTTFDE